MRRFTTDLGNDTCYIFLYDSCCHGWCQILCDDHCTCRNISDINIRRTGKDLKHTDTDISYVSCSLSGQFIIYLGEHGYEHITYAVNGCFCTFAITDQLLDLILHKWITHQNDMSFQNLCIMFSNLFFHCICHFLGLFNKNFHSILKSLKFSICICYCMLLIFRFAITDDDNLSDAITG